MSRGRLVLLAGHDSSGRAGVGADREVVAAAGLQPVVVVTAYTRQDAGGVRAVRPVPPSRWAAELRRALGSAPRALKVGLLPGAEHVRTLAALLGDARLPVVVDPVIAASSGQRFLDEAACEALVRELLPRGVILTPNLPEAALLSGREIAVLEEDPDERLGAARELLAAGARAVLLKGGHGREDPVRDLLLERGPAPPTARWIEHARVPGAAIGGSGCRYASGLAVALADGATLEEAAQRAAATVVARLRATN